MAIGSNTGVEFNLTSVQDNQVLVYDAAQGVFVNETQAVSANASVTGLGRNVGTTGVGIYKQNDSQYLEFFKLDAGANVTLSLNDNVITIDALIGSSTATVNSATANIIPVYDGTGNVVQSSTNLTYDGTTLNIAGASANVSTNNGVLTSAGLVTTNLTVSSLVYPTADGTNGQVLKTDGSGTLSWVNQTSVATKLDSSTFNAHVASAITTVSNHAPALDVTYSLGNSTNRYSQVFSEYFRGTADLAVNATNLGSQPAANYRLAADTYTNTQIDNLISAVAIPDVSSLLSNVTVTDGSTQFVQENGAVEVRSSDGSITVAVDTANKRLDLSTVQNTQNVFSRVRANNDSANTIIAETTTDILNFTNGTGINITANPSGDVVTIGTALSLFDLTDINASGITNGQVLKWDSTSSKFVAAADGGGGGGGIALTDLSVTSNSASGDGSLAYNSGTGVFTFTPADVGSLTQSLSWNAGTSTLSISSGNSVDLSVLLDNVDTQDLSISGNVISLVNGGSVDLTTAIATGGGNYGDSNVSLHLNTSSATAGKVLGWNGSDYAWVTDGDAQDITLSGNVISLTGQSGNVDLTTLLGSVTSDYGDSNVGTYLTAQGFATQSTIVAAITDSAPGTLDTLNELAAALGDDANFSTTITNSIATKADTSSLSTVATSGLYNDLTSRPTISVSGSDLTYDGTTLDLSGLGATGPTGATGPAGADGQTISSGAVSGSTLTLTMNDSSTITVSGSVQGATGAQGTAGTNGTNGTNGTDGIGVTAVSLVGGNDLTFTYSNTSTQSLGNIEGPQGATGATGAAGSDGADGVQLTDFSVTTGSASGGGTLSYNNGTGVTTFAPADLSSYLTSETFTSVVQDTTPQLGGDLDINGKDIVTTSNGDIDLDPNGSGVVVFKGNATKGSGQFKLNCENNSHGITIKGPPHSAGANYTLTLPNDDGNADQVLKTDGSGVLAWVDQSAGGGASAFNDLSDVSTAGVTSGQVLKYNGSSWAPAADNNSGGGGGATSFEYFKLHYTSAGAIDTTQGTGGISDKSTNMSNVTVNNAASNSCEIKVDFGSNYNYPPLNIIGYGYSQSTSEYNIKNMIQNTVNTTLKMDGSGSPHGSFGTNEITMSLTRSETGSSSGFGQTSHAWIYFTMGS